MKLLFILVLIHGQLYAQDTTFSRYQHHQYSILDENFEYTTNATVLVNGETGEFLHDSYDKRHIVKFPIFKIKNSYRKVRNEMWVYAEGYDTLNIIGISLPDPIYMIPSGKPYFDLGGGYHMGPQLHLNKLCVVLRNQSLYPKFHDLIDSLGLTIVGDSSISPWNHQLGDRVYLLATSSGDLAVNDKGKCPLIDSLRNHPDLFTIAGPAINKGMKETDIFTIDDQFYVKTEYGHEAEVSKLIETSGFFSGKTTQIEHNYIVIKLKGYTLEGLNEIVKKVYTLPHVISASWNSLLFTEIPNFPQPNYLPYTGATIKFSVKAK